VALDENENYEDERAEEEMWKESEWRHIAARHARNREACIAHYEDQAKRLEATLGALVDDYRERADRLRGGVA
jgi:hypothetical protein